MKYEIAYIPAMAPEELPRDRDVDVFVHDSGLEVTLTAATVDEIVDYVREFWGDDDRDWLEGLRMSATRFYDPGDVVRVQDVDGDWIVEGYVDGDVTMRRPGDTVVKQASPSMVRSAESETAEDRARADATLLDRQIGDLSDNALAVFVCDPKIRAWLEENDPQALAQARAALFLPEKVVA